MNDGTIVMLSCLNRSTGMCVPWTTADSDRLCMVLGDVQSILDDPMPVVEPIYIDSIEPTPIPSVEPTPIRPGGIKVVEQTFMTAATHHYNHDPDLKSLLSVLASSSIPQDMAPQNNELELFRTVLGYDYEINSNKRRRCIDDDTDATAISYDANAIPATKKNRTDVSNSDHQDVPDFGLPITLRQDQDCQVPEDVPDSTNHCQEHTGSRFRKYQLDQWNERYEELTNFRASHGRCIVKWSSHPHLARWIKRQRYQYRLKLSGCHSTLTDDRINKLNQIGFIWDSHDESWEERFLELKMYKEKYGDCQVPSSFAESPQLSVWVKSQRRFFKLTNSEGGGSRELTMTPDRVRRLNEIGFVWSLRKRYTMG